MADELKLNRAAAQQSKRQPALCRQHTSLGWGAEES